jgi:hypothetical protein
MEQNRRRKKSSGAGIFILGFLSGILVSGIIIISVAGYFLRNPQRMLSKAVDIGLNRVVEQTIQSIPKEYVARKQQELVDTAARFAEAFSQNRISNAEVDRLSQMVIQTVIDRQVTAEEIDELLEAVNRIVQ